MTKHLNVALSGLRSSIFRVEGICIILEVVYDIAFFVASLLEASRYHPQHKYWDEFPDVNVFTIIKLSSKKHSENYQAKLSYIISQCQRFVTAKKATGLVLEETPSAQSAGKISSHLPRPSRTPDVGPFSTESACTLGSFNKKRGTSQFVR